MKPQFLFITGTDTGAGKTVLATQLTRFLRERGVRVAALKPLCSGGRADAVALWTAAGKVLALDEVNPWHFRASLAPVLAARREGKQVRLAEVMKHIRRVSRGFEVVVVEGAGGLLSPLGEDFASRELIVALRATPIIVSPNRLGAVSQIRLTLEALPVRLAERAQVVFFDLPKPDSATRTNAALLGEFIEPRRIRRLPWLGAGANLLTTALRRGPRRILETLVIAALPRGGQNVNSSG
jgi:dethiobiotin synthetase